MKKYIAKTNVSINVMLPSGTNRHIAFSALTGGGSVFYTDDPDIIQAMERHYKYGTLFRADPKYIAEKQHNKPDSKPNTEVVAGQTDPPVPAVSADPTTDNADNSESKDASESDSEDGGLKTIVVSDPDAAKAYLAEHFGISRTKLKYVKTIKEVAAANGIVFEGI